MYSTILIVFLTLAVILAILAVQVQGAWPIARPAIDATWPMGPKEGFANQDESASSQDVLTESLKKWLPSPEVVTKPSVGDCPGTLLNAAPSNTGKPYKSYDLLDGWMVGKPEPRIAFGPTSQKCYDVDYAVQLEKSSFAQRTNNYRRGYPDSCSAPLHDLVLDMYEPRPSKGPDQILHY
jgi:hypothetical protein